jgi:hypothetical protein
MEGRVCLSHHRIARKVACLGLARSIGATLTLML